MKRAAACLLSTAIVLATAAASADPESPAPSPPPPDRWATRPSVMSGLGQWTVFGGGNVAAQVKFGRFVIEYSHGQALDYDRLGGFAKTAAEKSAGISLFSPWTTGGGVGFQITPRLHVLVEVKAHRYEVTSADRASKLAYTTFSVGPGVFYDLYLYKGLFVQPNLRFWPNVGDTLKPNALGHQAHSLDFFANVNVGWTFSGI
jgi:opacity protein-like surface antigen